MTWYALSFLFITLFSLSCWGGKDPEVRGGHLIVEAEKYYFADKLRQIPSFVAYGRYKALSILGSREGVFKVYKTDDGITIRAGQYTLGLGVDSLIRTAVSAKIKGDTTYIMSRSGKVVFVGERLISIEDKGLVVELRDYSYTPVPFPRYITVKYMGVLIEMFLDSLVLLDDS